VWEWTGGLSPEAALVERVRVGDARPEELRLSVLDGEREVLAYRPAPEGIVEMPDPAQAVRRPGDVATVEDLYLAGLHLEQYRHATRDPEAYYREALRRAPGDARCNNALGLLLFRRGLFAEAEAHFRAAVASLTKHNPNPYDGEPFHNLGLALMMQGRFDEAYSAFYKATWNAAWQDAAFFQLARLASRAGRHEEALDLVERSLLRNARNHRARHLKTALLRSLGRPVEAEREAEATLEADPLDHGALAEHYMLSQDNGESEAAMCSALRGASDNYIELALDYAYAGLYTEAITVLERAIEDDARLEPGGYRDPMVHYHLAWFQRHVDDMAKMREHYEKAASLPPDYGFPHSLEAMLALRAAVKENPGDASAWYYLGNLYYGKRRHEDAIAAWERSREIDPAFPTVHRNLALAYVNERHDEAAALAPLTEAFRLDPDDARVLYELDQLHKRMNRDPAGRLALLEEHRRLVEARDDLYIEHVALLNRLGRHGEALERLARRRFHPWEGGEGKVTGQYVFALVETAKALLDQGRPAEAIEALQRAKAYPENLGEGKLAGAQENHVHYWLGRAHRNLGDEEAARAMFERASAGLAEPASTMFYNDQPPDMIFYQGLALRALGREDEARGRFRRLIDYGEKHLDDHVEIDYFAVSLPDFLVFEDDLDRRNRVHCLYMIGLGRLGFGDAEKARTALETALALDINHTGAWTHLPWTSDWKSMA